MTQRAVSGWRLELSLIALTRLNTLLSLVAVVVQVQLALMVIEMVAEGLVGF
jgi:hypothetical protein